MPEMESHRDSSTPTAYKFSMEALCGNADMPCGSGEAGNVWTHPVFMTSIVICTASGDETFWTANDV